MSLRKKIVVCKFLVIMFIMSIQFIPISVKAMENNEINSNFSVGDGTIENPYVIRTARELNNIRNDLSAHYILENDIDLSEYDNWIAIGSEGVSFTGSLNGNNHVIKNMKINELAVVEEIGTRGFAGLFGRTDSKAKIENIIIKNMSILITFESDIDSFYIGGIAGESLSNSYIKNCEVYGKIEIKVDSPIRVDSGALTLGGIAGNFGGKIYNCINYADIDIELKNKYEKTVRSGGIVGKNSGFINQCSNYGNIKAISKHYLHCGGICGESSSGGVNLCRNYGSIYGNSYATYLYSPQCNVGGICGQNRIFSEIVKSVNYADIYGYTQGKSYGYVGASCIIKI